MILESIENGPLLWPSVKENRVTRPMKYSELSATKVIQSDFDVKAINIILQGLSPEVYALVENEVIELYFVNTEYQLADLFTKALGRDRIEYLINKLGMRSFTPETLKQLTDEVVEYWWTMDTTIDQQVVMDEALVPHARRLRIGRSNFRLLSDVEHKDTKKSNKMYYPRHQNTQQFGAMIPIELTNADIRNSDAYKEYYAVATEATPPKTKASPRLTTSKIGKQAAKASKAKSPSALSEVAMTEAQQLKLATKRSLQQTHISQASGFGTDEGTGDDGDDGEEGNDDDDDDEQDDGDAQDDDNQEDEGNDEDDKEEGSDDEQASDEEEFIHPSLSTHAEEETRDEEKETRNEESFDPIPKTPEDTDDEGNGRGIQMADVHMTQEFKDSHVTLTSVNPDGQQQSSSVSSQFMTMAPLPVSTPTLTHSTIATITTTQQAPIPPTTAPSTLLQDLPNFGSLFRFDHRLKTLKANFSEFIQTNQFARAVSSIPGIVQRYIDHRMNEAVKVGVQIQSDRLRDETQAENDKFLKTIDENMQTIIKEQVKEQVSKILPKIEQTVNEKLEAEVLTRQQVYQMINKQRNFYKALVKAYESDKIILDTYGDTITLKRHRDNDADKDEEPSAGSDRGSKRRRKGKEPESASAPKEKATRSAGKSTQGSKSQQTSASDESATAEEPMQTTFEMEEPSHPDFETGADDQPIVESFQHPEWFSQQKKPPTPDRDWNKTLLATHGSIQPKDDKYDSRRTICFQRLSSNVYKKHRNPKARERTSTRCRKLPEEAQPNKAGTYRSDLKRKEAYIAYSNPRGFIYQNKDKQNRLMRIDELHKFSDGTLTDVRTALDDHLKGIHMKYLPQTIWRKSDKERATAMIQAIDKKLKTRRIMRSLKRFVGGRPYEGDFKMLQRTI
nr:hypothetical protein [Tanacetum cinerariifolium]